MRCSVKKKPITAMRLVFYVIGLVFAVLGVTMATRTGFGVSPITSFPFSVSQATGMPLAGLNFTLYMIMVAAQFILRGKNRRWKDLLQIPMSIAFNVLLGWFDMLFPATFSGLGQRIALLAGSILLCGISVFLLVNMDIVANPPDNLAKTISDVSGKNLGLVKNIMDAISVSVAFSVDIFGGKGIFTSVGVGTVISMIFIGRTVALCEHFFKKQLLRAAGLQES